MSVVASTHPSSQRFADLIEYLRRTLSEKGYQRRVYGPLLLMIWSRLGRMMRRFASIEARLRAGTLVTRPARAKSTAPRRFGPPRPPTWMQPEMAMPVWSGAFGCLQKLVPETHMSAGQLCQLLQEPELRALFAEAPQLGQILRPLARMLGLRLVVLGAELLPGLELPKRPRVRKPRPPSEPKPARPSRRRVIIRLGVGDTWRGPTWMWPTRELVDKFDAKTWV